MYGANEETNANDVEVSFIHEDEHMSLVTTSSTKFIILCRLFQNYLEEYGDLQRRLAASLPEGSGNYFSSMDIVYIDRSYTNLSVFMDILIPLFNSLSDFFE